jgi:hypothetical protein
MLPRAVTIFNIIQQGDYMQICEVWKKRSEANVRPESEMENCMVPPSAERGEYCIADSSHLRSLCGNQVHKILPFMKHVVGEGMCKKCEQIFNESVSK